MLGSQPLVPSVEFSTLGRNPTLYTHESDTPFGPWVLPKSTRAHGT
jgi:hypothetical protein